jgi:hypothetical protein
MPVSFLLARSSKVLNGETGFSLFPGQVISNNNQILSQNRGEKPSQRLNVQIVCLK